VMPRCRRVDVTGWSSPDAAQLGAGSAMTKVRGALLGREDGGAGGQVLQHAGNGHFGHGCLGVLRGLLIPHRRDGDLSALALDAVARARRWRPPAARRAAGLRERLLPPGSTGRFASTTGTSTLRRPSRSLATAGSRTGPSTTPAGGSSPASRKRCCCGWEWHERSPLRASLAGRRVPLLPAWPCRRRHPRRRCDLGRDIRDRSLPRPAGDRAATHLPGRRRTLPPDPGRRRPGRPGTDRADPAALRHAEHLPGVEPRRDLGVPPRSRPSPAPTTPRRPTSRPSATKWRPRAWPASSAPPTSTPSRHSAFTQRSSSSLPASSNSSRPSRGPAKPETGATPSGC
jgi:hypothetical protein